MYDDEIADRMNDFRNRECEDMSDAEIAALKALRRSAPPTSTMIWT